ncbi:MIA40 [Candida pseudojiufengensis]|uniref:MIA40 n=1 Tax=Candida pseudojiufengensis TaxID=497109 RepID=UPI0022243F2F|nr:MIA40 [Candida pseudojiufengensis]KAI5966477.1 MIA40 [Candida pseudojiufengensis]
MYRQFTRSSIARQASRSIRSYSTNASNSSSKFNTKLVIGSIVPIAVAIGYYSLNNSSINNSSPIKVAADIRKDFKVGNEMAEDQNELFEEEQKRLQKEQDKEELNQKEDIKKQTTKDAKGAERKDISTDSDVRQRASDNIDPDKITRHSRSDSKQKADESSKNDKTSNSDNKPDENTSSSKHDSTDKSSSSKGDSNKNGDDEKQEAAYNPETGEINWDCPCLGGMAHGPCGEEFKDAFSCFVFSETEPKGIDCIKKFENMRSCFKQNPDHYKEELYDDDDKEYNTEVVEHIVLEEADPAVQQIEDALDEGKLKNPEKK